MAFKGSQIAVIMPKVELKCPICLDLVKDPVTIPCGHSFCEACIKHHWASRCRYLCPHCRHLYETRPRLSSNCMLRSLVERVPRGEGAGMGDVPCDVCEDDRLPASRACVTCRANFCEAHLQPHLGGGEALAWHRLCQPIVAMKLVVCGPHSRLLEFFCKSHWCAVCALCLPRHRRCSVATVEEMRSAWEAENNAKRGLIGKRRERIKEAEVNLTDTIDGISVEAERMKADLGRHFGALRKAIDQAQKRANALVESNMQKALEQAGGLQEEIWTELSGLEDTEEELDNRDLDGTYFNFLTAPVLLPPPLSRAAQLPGADIQLDGEAVERMGSHLGALLGSLETQLRASLHQMEEWREMGGPTDDFQVVNGHRKPRSKLLKYACELTFDPHAASTSVLLSEDGRTAKVECSDLLAWKDYQVFDEMGFRVLCSQSFSRGQHYWEVSPPEDVSGSWGVGVAYSSGEDRYQSLGRSKRSWCVGWQGEAVKGEKGSEKGNLGTVFTKAEAGACPSKLEDGTAAEIETTGLPNKSEEGGVPTNPRKEDTEQGGGVRAEEAGVPTNPRKEGAEPRKEDTEQGGGVRAEEAGVPTNPRKEDTEQGGGVRAEEGGDRTKARREVPGDRPRLRGLFACHDSRTQQLSQQVPDVMGVHLDCDGGRVSFLSVSGSKVRLLYRFEMLFLEPLHPAIWLREPGQRVVIGEVCGVKGQSAGGQ